MIYIQHGHWTESFEFLIDGKIKKLWMIPKKNVKEGIKFIPVTDIKEVLAEALKIDM